MLSKKKAIALVVTFVFLLAGCNTAENQQAPAERTPPPVVEQEVPKPEPEQPETPAHNFKKGEWSPELTELMSQINAKHAAVTQEQPDPTLYKREPRENGTMYQNEEGKGYLSTLTAEQAVEDVNLLFDAYQNVYSLYSYFGGAETFEAAREDIIAECSTKETMTSDELQQILLDHLDFVEDAHMNINGQYAVNFSFPFFFRETAFVKTENGYATTDGKKVATVEGSENLEDLFKPSIDKNGELVYYPILIQEVEGSSKLSNWYSTEHYNCETTLTVQYEDGTVQTLTGEPYQPPKTDPDRETLSIHENNGVPIVTYTTFVDQSIGGRTMEKMFSQFEDSPVLIVDLRCNQGGWPDMKKTFTNKLFGEPLPQNFVVVNTWSGEAFEEIPEKMVDNDKLVIILTDKLSASMTEYFLDSTYNLENTLIIGESTHGCLIAGDGMHLQLTNSGLYVNMDRSRAVHFPEGMPFKEFEGFRPDIWVPSGEAEEAAVAFVNNMMK